MKDKKEKPESDSGEATQTEGLVLPKKKTKSMSKPSKMSNAMAVMKAASRAARAPKIK